MKVKALERGYYGNLRRDEGQEFTLEDASHFSKKWMVSLDGSVVEEKPAKKKKKASKKVEVEEPVASEDEVI